MACRQSELLEWPAACIDVLEAIGQDFAGAACNVTALVGGRLRNDLDYPGSLNHFTSVDERRTGDASDKSVRQGGLIRQRLPVPIEQLGSAAAYGVAHDTFQLGPFDYRAPRHACDLSLTTRPG